MSTKKYVVWRTENIKAVSYNTAMRDAQKAVAEEGRPRAYILRIMGHAQKQQPVVEYVIFEPALEEA